MEDVWCEFIKSDEKYRAVKVSVNIDILLFIPSPHRPVSITVEIVIQCHLLKFAKRLVQTVVPSVDFWGTFLSATVQLTKFEFEYLGYEQKC